MPNNFQILSDHEHIRKRFSMYGGSQVEQSEEMFIEQDFKTVNVVGGLLKIINEIIDNSIDENVRTKGKFANEISIKVEDNGYITVADNGRGIPSEKVMTTDGEKWQLEAAFTMARAGSNFDDDNRESIGMNGVGSAITYVTSSHFTAEAHNNGIQVKLANKNGKLTVTDTKCDKKLHGTTVRFKPEYEFFGLDNINEQHLAVIRNRVETLAVAFPDIRFKFNARVVKANVKTLFGDAHFFHTEKATFGVRVSQRGHNSFSIVNGLSVKSGSHIDHFAAEVVGHLRTLIKKRKKIDMTPAKIKQHLTIFCVVNGFKALKFDSQTKEVVTNSTAEVKEAIGSFDAEAFAKKLFKDADLIGEIVAVYELQQKLAEKKDLKKMEKVKRIKSDKYFPAIGETKRIFIVEGDSASGGLIKCLGRKGNAFYAMKGVPLNVLEVSHQKFMANKELSELYQIITNFDEAEIIIATDADADGSRITGLVSLFMFKYFKEHSESGNLRILRTPLAVGRKGNKIVDWAYTFQEVNGMDQKLSINYIKGLGSLNPADLKVVMDKDGLEQMLPKMIIDDETILHNWFSGKTSDFRKEQILQAQPFNIERI